MNRFSLGISGLIGLFVAAFISQRVLMRASWLLRPDFDRTAFLVRFGSGPMVGLALLVLGVITFCGCRSMLRRFATSTAFASDSRMALLSLTARLAGRGIGGGLLAGATIAWILIAIDGMGNGGDTSIVRLEVLDVVKPSLFGMGICLLAALSLRMPKRDAAAKALRRRPRSNMRDAAVASSS